MIFPPFLQESRLMVGKRHQRWDRDEKQPFRYNLHDRL